MLARADLVVEDVALFVPHQANDRIIELARRRLRVPPEKIMVNIDRYGNTSAATIPVALAEAVEGGRVAPGANLLLAAFGAGLTRGAGLVRWGERTEPLASSDAALPECSQTALEILGPAIRHTL